MKLLIQQFSPVPFYILLLQPNYLPQHPTVKLPQPMFFPYVKDYICYLHKTTEKIIFPQSLI
jgi:hypothetical protein